jgi:DNA-binding transcriptional ArsR family regulator
MSDVLQMAEIRALIGDAAHANMLLALGDGRALPAGELAYAARLSPQTASGHLARLVGAGLLSVVSQWGRHRYYRLASARVGALLEAALAVAADVPPRTVLGGTDAALRARRTCYNHLAGRLGVTLADALLAAGHVRLAEDGAGVTPQGLDFFPPWPRPGADASSAVLPHLHRLERTPAASLRRARRCTLPALPGARLDRAPARQPRRPGDGSRRDWAAIRIRVDAGCAG